MPSHSKDRTFKFFIIILLFVALVTTAIVAYLPVKKSQEMGMAKTSSQPSTILRVLDSEEIDSPILKAKLSFYDDTYLYYPSSHIDRSFVEEKEPSQALEIIPSLFATDELQTATLKLFDFNSTIRVNSTMQQVITRKNIDFLISSIGNKEATTNNRPTILASYQIFSYSEQKVVQTGILETTEDLPKWHRDLWIPVVCEVIIDNKSTVGSIFLSQSNLGDSEEQFLIDTITTKNLFEDLPNGYYQITIGP